MFKLQQISDLVTPPGFQQLCNGCLLGITGRNPLLMDPGSPLRGRFMLPENFQVRSASPPHANGRS